MTETCYKHVPVKPLFMWIVKPAMRHGVFSKWRHFPPLSPLSVPCELGIGSFLTRELSLLSLWRQIPFQPAPPSNCPPLRHFKNAFFNRLNCRGEAQVSSGARKMAPKTVAVGQEMTTKCTHPKHCFFVLLKRTSGKRCNHLGYSSCRESTLSGGGWG